MDGIDYVGGAIFYRGQEFKGEIGYGVFPGGDPRRYVPDEECCSSDEVARWEEACRLWDLGEPVELLPGCRTFGDGSAWTGEGLGIGTYVFDLEEETEP